MTSVEVKEKKISSRVTEELQKQIKAAAKAKGLRAEQWIEDAVRAKLNGEGVEPAERLILARLDGNDWELVEAFVGYLRVWPRGIKIAAMEALEVFARHVRNENK